MITFLLFVLIGYVGMWVVGKTWDHIYWNHQRKSYGLAPKPFRAAVRK